MSAKTNFSHTPQDYRNMFVDGIKGYKLTITIPTFPEDKDKIEKEKIDRFIIFLAALAYEKEWTTPQDTPFGYGAKLVSPKIYNKLYPELSSNEAKKEFAIGMKLFVEGVNPKKIDDCGLLNDFGISSDDAGIYYSPIVGYHLSSCANGTTISGTFVIGEYQIGRKKYINITPDILKLADF